MIRISIKQFLSPNHSWGKCGSSLARAFVDLGHNVDLCSTNGYANFPKDLEQNIVCKNCIIDNKETIGKSCLLRNDYDLALSYTRLRLFESNLMPYSTKNRFGIWNYDGTQIPYGYCKHYKFATKLLPSSEFSKNVFIQNKIPASVMTVVPHGYDEEYITRKDVYPIKTSRKRKVLVNIQQPHVRKNIPGILEAWGKAFTDKDDVVMIAKVKPKGVQSQYEVSWVHELLNMKKKYKNHAPIIILNEFVDYISDLYRACDIVFSSSHVECFNLPLLEGLAANKLVIGSNWGGNIDFATKENSLLIDGKIGRASADMQYWEDSVFGECFYPSSDCAAEQLVNAYNNYDFLMEKFQPGIDYVKEKYTWKNAAKQIISLME